MESAIPAHLKCPRLREPRASADYNPPYPAWVARLPAGTQQVVMAYLGVQGPPGQEARALAALQTQIRQLEMPHGPKHHDLAQCVDEAGYCNYVVVAYWQDVESFCRWAAQPAVSEWWGAPERASETLGYFREVFCPRVTHFETLFSTPDQLEGVARLAEGLSDEIQEHGYWGGMRDRIPASQTDALAAQLGARVSGDTPAPGRRVHLQGHDHVALIRSGQDWRETQGQERTLYLQDIEPALRDGMNFLRDQGHGVGCYYNRYMQHIDVLGQPQEKSFGLSLWKTLEHMERWSESHPTHISIFGTFMRVVQQMNFQLKLRLYHEVLVVEADEQLYEYVNCHPNTGILRKAHAQANT